jgi:FkbM family methyltransferase
LHFPARVRPDSAGPRTEEAALSDHVGSAHGVRPRPSVTLKRSARQRLTHLLRRLGVAWQVEVDDLARRVAQLEERPVSAEPQPQHSPVIATQNARYDEQTVQVMERVLGPSDSCIDIGAHVGDVLREMLRLAPQGRHIAFEPLPELADALIRNFPQVDVHQAALADSIGETSFQRVASNPSYSGLLLRHLDGEGERVEEITVPVRRLDDLVGPDRPIRFIKIDVEGAEENVLRGGAALIQRDRPVIVFEHGLGAADVYGTRPETIYDLFDGWRFSLCLMEDWLNGAGVLSRDDFVHQFETNANYYFMALSQE